VSWVVFRAKVTQILRLSFLCVSLTGIIGGFLIPLTLLGTSTFGSNSMARSMQLATLYCWENEKHWTPSNIVSHDVHLFRRHRFCHNTNVLEVTRPMSWTWQERHLRCGKSDVLDVARAMSWRWKERRPGRGKRDVLEVAREMSWMWQEKRLGGGKRDNVLEVARETLRGISSDVVAMGETLLEVERVTSWRWQERRLGGGKRDVLDMARATLRGIISDVVSMGETLQDITIATVL
jgi:hypothetical protein